MTQMMDLVKYSPEGLERVKYFMMCKGNFRGNFRAVRNICEFEETFGFRNRNKLRPFCC